MINLAFAVVVLVPLVLLLWLLLRGERPKFLLKRRVVFQRMLTRQLVFGYCSLAAARFAELPTLWATICMIHYILAGVGSAGLAHASRTLMPVVKKSPLSRSRADVLVKRFVQTAYLALWVFSWRHFLINWNQPSPLGSTELNLALIVLPVFWIVLCYVIGTRVGEREVVRTRIDPGSARDYLAHFLAAEEYQAIILSPLRTPEPFLQFRKGVCEGRLVCDFPLAAWSEESFDTIQQIALNMKIDFVVEESNAESEITFARYQLKDVQEAAEFSLAVIKSKWPAGASAVGIEAALLLS